MHLHVSGKDAIDEVLLRQVEGALQLVVVEGDLSRAGAVEPGFGKGGPGVLQQEASTDVVLTDSGHSRVHRLPTVMLYCVLPQEEEGKEPDVIRRDELRL